LALNSFQTSGNSPGSTRCRVGFLGYGTVGSAIARRLTSPGDNHPLSHLQLTHICDRRAREKRVRAAGAIARDRAAIVPAPVLGEPGAISGLSDHKLAEAV
jgi:homoserine dehydrogenase